MTDLTKMLKITKISSLVLFFSLVFFNESLAQSPEINSVVNSSTESTTDSAIDSLLLAKQFFENNKYEKALNIALSLYNTSVREKNRLKQIENSLLIAEIFKKTRNYKKALVYYYSYLDLIKDSSSVEQKANTEIIISHLLYYTDQKDAAISVLDGIILLPKQSKEIELIKAKAFTNLSGIYTEKEKLVKAENNAYNAIEIYEKHEKPIKKVASLNNLASVFIAQKRYKDAKRVLLDALSLLKNKSNVANAKISVNNNLAYTLFQLKDYHAYEYARRGFNIKDSITNSEMKLALSEIESKFNAENERREGELRTANERAKKEQAISAKTKAENRNTILGFLIISLIVASLFLFYFFKTRQKNREELLQSESREKVLNATLDGKETERKVIAETLHNSVSALLSSASLHLQAVKMQLDEPIPEEIEKAQVIVSEAATSIRNLSHSLVSNVLLKFGLGYAIKDLTQKISNTKLNFQCDCKKIMRFDQSFELKINSIIDELFNNIIKHSGASEAFIKIAHINDDLFIWVKDNGKGFDSNSSFKKDGLGLHQIETRVKKMEGLFTIKSLTGIGTNVKIKVPVVYKKN